ncbi:MAG: DUF2911 domain-containing protein [Bacteroidia bacterium]|nr:DUF2911 domain-containing protein [Bacteroidia bacterium]MBT8279074.1 DUF2911 domain-containing protein [Bacteroidia bacterium]NNK59974.1 DUF2911 domain-containing protein [Flavobacteriaceae bacterium]NNL33639.1 DUF2911 domain-containing protein [Flavobacteriaceae bacterium]
MKTKLILLFIAITLTSCKQEKTNLDEHNHSEEKMEQKEVTKKKPLSPHTSTMAMIGDAHIHIDYSSPGVRDRIIFGGLVGYDQVWQAGAHMATWIETNKDLIIDGKTLPAGKYGFFTIPSKGDWTLMINKNWDQHGKDEYDEKDDVVRFKVTPTISDEITEHLEYKVNKVNESEGTISLAWEKVALSFPFKVIQ